MRWVGIWRWAIFARKVSRDRSAVVQSASCSCRGPWCSGGRLKCRLNLADAAWRHSIGSVRCSPLGPGRSYGSSGGGEVTGEEFDQSAILLFLIGVVEHFAVVSGLVGSVLSSPGLVRAAEEGDFLGYEFPCGGGCEVAVVEVGL